MKQGLSRKLALGNILKNYRFFIPRILAETGLLACFYIIFTLACDGRLADIKGGNYLPTFMWMGAVIIGLLSAILMLYTNSFLMKQRKREFGLYSVLGMEKKHICRILLHESLICCAISVIAGLACGILFYKLASAAICRLLKAEIIAGFYYITPQTIIPAGAVFVAIDVLAYVVNCIGIGRMKPVELLASTSTGEKEPRVKWVMLIAGVITLGAGYVISLTTESPLAAIMLFFAAVLLVIAGTYFLFIAGSIFVLKALKKKESYYYRPGHITAVSGLMYRMKQNAVGLASVAILATGVLVMISSTFCLYFRTESALNTSFPQDFYISASYDDESGEKHSIPQDALTEIVDVCAQKNGLKLRDVFTQEYFDVAFRVEPGALIADNDRSVIGEAELCLISFITEDMYVERGGEPLGLAKNEVAVCPYNVNEGFPDTDFTMLGKEYTVAKQLDFFPIRSSLLSVSCFGMVVADDAVFSELFEAQREAYGTAASDLEIQYCVSFTDRDKTYLAGDDFVKDLNAAIDLYFRSQGIESWSFSSDNIWDARESLYGMYGSLLFLGVLLGIVCLFATVLIIYYKQISEGYEDRSRFQIMLKIGMTDAEVKKTIRSQIMLVFFLPLVTAGIHVAFAFPILSKLMAVLLLDSISLFAKWCVIVYIVFAAVYALIYKLTARTYYKIVY